MAVATREMHAVAPSAPERSRPVTRAWPAAVVAPEPRAAARPERARPAQQPDYDAPMSPWPLFLYLLLLFLAVNAAFIWAGVRAAGA